MARSFSSAKLLSRCQRNVQHLCQRWVFDSGTRATAQVARAGGATRSGTAAVKKTGEEERTPSSDRQVSWAPDPRNGCYRPENYIEEIDVAELRAKHLRKKE
ncbi:hypothetical protein BT93_K0909 [Corymbia citriodora subsp. variegata]|nr:hypothetical protein BT93_K0909 [Corymbia citriodora subsp. variegata]